MTDLAEKFEIKPNVLRRVRWAVSAIFCLNGMVSGALAPQIAIVKERLGLSELDLGAALLAVPVGAIIGLVAGGAASARWGSAGPTRWLALAIGFAFFATVNAPSYAMLLVALAFFGFVVGSLDVSMNAHGAAVEMRAARPIMSSFHGWFSLGALVGAGASALVLRVLTPFEHSVASALTILVVAILSVAFLLPSEEDRNGDGEPVLALPRGPVLLLGLVAALVLMAEGSVLDWSAVWATETLGRTVSEGALVFTVFSLGMVIGRFSGDGLRARYAASTLLKTSGAMIVIGFGLALLVETYVSALIGYLVLGLGLSVTVPIAFSEAARSKTMRPVLALAAVTTMGYSGFLVGPPMIGFLAHATDLTTALGFIVLIGALVIVLAPRIKA